MPAHANAKLGINLLADSNGRKALRQALDRWFKTAGRDLPWRRTHDPYAILVSEMMLQQTQVATVIPYFERWMARFPTFAALAAATESEVMHAWQGLGYYARARNLHRAAKAVTAEWNGEMPPQPEEIGKLPGIGRYTAGAVASFAFDQPVAAVDANIARVLSRLFNLQDPIDTAAGQAAVWRAADSLLPIKGGRLHNSALMELGALICTARTPACLVCPVQRFCQTTEPEVLPRKKARKGSAAMLEECAWVHRNGRLLLEFQQGPRWKGLWKLPPLEIAGEKGELLREATYPFTHHRVTFRVFRGEAPKVLTENLAWILESEVESTPMTSPHRKAAESLLKGG